MTAIAITPPFPVFQDVDGSPLTDGFIYVGTSGLNPQTNPLAVYWDAALTQPAAQPLRTSGGYIVNSGSVARVFTGAAGYSLVVRNKNGSLVWSTLSISGGGVTSVDSALVVYAQTAAELAAGITPTNMFWPSVQRDAGSIKRFGAVCDGITDDTVAFQRAVNSAPAVGGYVYVPGNTLLSSQILISAKTGLLIEIERSAIITFTDGAYVGFQFTGGQHHKILNGSIYGSNTSAPTITLVQIGAAGGGNQCPLCVIEGVVFSYASKCVYLANTYETVTKNNFYTNSDQYIVSGGLGSCTDIEFLGETFASSTIGTNYLVQVVSNGTRITDAYWETANHTKGNLIIKTGAQYTTITGGLAMTSGEFKVELSNNVVVNGFSMQDCYDSVNLRTWRVDGSSNVTFGTCQIAFSVVVANVSAMVASGNLVVNGNMFLNCHYGVFGGLDSIVSGNRFVGCVEGVHAGAAMRVSDNVFSTCTTGISVQSASAVIGKNYYVACGTNITDGTGGAASIDEATKGQTATVADGGTITHGHAKTPRRVIAVGSVASQFIAVTAIGATTFTVAIKKDDGTAGTAQTIYWEVSG